MKAWIQVVGAKTAFIESESPLENGYAGSFNGRTRDGLLNGGIFYFLRDVQIIIEGRRKYNDPK